MKLPQLFREAGVPQVDFSRFLNPYRPEHLPPLDTRKLVLEALTGQARLRIQTPHNGTGTLLVRYKGREGGLLSIDEQEEGETWDVTQVQGAKNKSGYRLATGLNWHQLLAKRTREYAGHPESEVRRITMAPTFSMENICDARSENVGKGYDTVKHVLEMRWSDELKLFVTDVRNKFSR